MSKRLELRIPEDLHHHITTLAAQREISVSEAARQLLCRHNSIDPAALLASYDAAPSVDTWIRESLIPALGRV